MVIGDRTNKIETKLGEGSISEHDKLVQEFLTRNSVQTLPTYETPIIVSNRGPYTDKQKRIATRLYDEVKSSENFNVSFLKSHTLSDLERNVLKSLHGGVAKVSLFSKVKKPLVVKEELGLLFYLNSFFEEKLKPVSIAEKCCLILPFEEKRFELSCNCYSLTKFFTNLSTLENFSVSGESYSLVNGKLRPYNRRGYDSLGELVIVPKVLFVPNPYRLSNS